MIKIENVVASVESRPGLPVRTVQEFVGDLYSGIGLASPRAFASRAEGEGQPRFPFTRVKRAEVFLHRKLRNVANYADNMVNKVSRSGKLRVFRNIVDRYKPHKGLEYYHNLDVFDQQFQTLHESEINMGEIGDIKARYSRVAIESLRKESRDKDRSPIFIIPAYAGDVYGVEPLAREYAMEGNEVYTLPAPEAYMGTTTEKFAKAVEDTQSSEDNVNFEPHTTYYQTLIEKIMMERGIKPGAIKIVGYSTGGAITFELLSKKDFSVKEATIFAPASCVKQNMATFILGLTGELKGITGFMKPINSAVTIDRPDMESAELSRRNRIADIQLKKVRSKSYAYKGARTTSNRIVVVSGSGDKITKSDQVLSEMLAGNPYIQVVRAKNMTHVGPLYESERLVKALENRSVANNSNSTQREFTYDNGEIQ